MLQQELEAHHREAIPRYIVPRALQMEKGLFKEQIQTHTEQPAFLNRK